MFATNNRFSNLYDSLEVKKMPHNDMDYCDLDPTKLCDNCCKWIETGRDYEEFQLEELTHRITEVDDLNSEVYEDGEGEFELYLEEVDYSIDPSNVPPIDIDPELLAEWERKLKIAEIEDNRKLIQNLHGSRRAKKHE